MQSIRSSLLIALLITGLLPLGIIYFVTGQKTAEALKRGEYAKIKEMAVQMAGQLRSIMDGAADDLQSLSSNPFLANIDAPMMEREREMNRLVGVYDMFSDITLYDPLGFSVCSTTSAQPENHEHSVWFKKALEGSRVISDPHRVLNDPTGRLYLSVFIPVMSQSGEVANIVKARIPFDRVWELFDRVQLGENGYMVLVDEKGNRLTHTYRPNVLTKFDEKLPFDYWRNNPQGVYDFGGNPEHRALYVAVVLPPEMTRVGREWALIAFEPEAEVEALVVEQRQYLLGVGLATLIFVVAFGYLLGSVFARPLIQASAISSSMAEGDAAIRMADSGPKEVRELAKSFNKMAEEVRHHRDHLQSLVRFRTMKLEESQAHLENLSAQLRSSYDAAAEAILVVSRDGNVIAANRKVAQFFGLEPTSFEGLEPIEVGVRLGGCFKKGAEFLNLWEKLSKNPEQVEEAEWIVAKPKELILYLYSAPVRGREGEVLARLWMFRDLTSERHLQANLEQSQKMDAIGRLAGGVAHDFNNLLTGILGNLSLIELDLGDSLESETAGYLRSAKKASQRAADLVRQLLGFSRQSTLRMRRVEIGDIVDEVEDLLHASISPDISVSSEIQDGLWSIEADSTQIQQVLMNMCVNARDALPGGMGKIVIRAENTKVRLKQAALKGGKTTEYVCLSISDNGSGIPPEVLEKIWEPFFTTKEQGKGTGLGLATSYGIVQQHGGWIDCESVLGEGTTFKVFIPRQEYEEEVAAQTVESKVLGGDETILLVDDEVMVRTVAQGFLKRQGYQTMTASDGLEAVEIIQEKGDQVSLVLLDLTMPRLSGKDTFRKIREMYPEMPVVICSGYLLDIGEFECETGFRPSGMVQKPYKTEDLLSTVRDAIDNPIKATRIRRRGQ